MTQPKSGGIAHTPISSTGRDTGLPSGPRSPSLELRCTLSKPGCHHRDDTCKYGCNKADLACASRNSSIRHAQTTVSRNETLPDRRTISDPSLELAMDWDMAADMDSTCTRHQMGLGIE
jgi:hypothetical protein